MGKILKLLLAQARFLPSARFVQPSSWLCVCMSLHPCQKLGFAEPATVKALSHAKLNAMLPSACVWVRVLCHGQSMIWGLEAMHTQAADPLFASM